MNLKKIAIIVPIYNEGKTLRIFHIKLCNVLKSIDEYTWEVIYVDDGSTDNSWEEIQLIINDPQYPIKISALRFSRNFGKELALTAGIEHSNADAVICMDSDLQHPPKLIPDFLKKWEQGYEIIVGLRKQVEDFSIVRKLGSKIFYYLMRRFASIDVYPRSTDFRLLDKKVVDVLKTFEERTRLVRGLIDWVGFKKEYIIFNAPSRHNGNSSFNLRKLIDLAINSFTSFSLLPLKLTAYLGLGISGSSFLLLCYMLFGKFFLRQFYTPLAFFTVFNTFLIGIVLCALGMIALYIGHIHTEVVKRPLYIVKEMIGFE